MAKRDEASLLLTSEKEWRSESGEADTSKRMDGTDKPAGREERLRRRGSNSFFSRVHGTAGLCAPN